MNKNDLINLDQKIFLIY